jgi:DNA-directed RNA polymerase specialized sigma24 family protein
LGCKYSASVAVLYQDHHGWLQAWLRKKLGCAYHAADLAHDTFVRILSSRRESLGREPRALLTHIAKGLVIDHWRRQEVERAYLEVIADLREPLASSAEAQALALNAAQVSNIASISGIRLDNHWIAFGEQG